MQAKVLSIELYTALVKYLEQRPYREVQALMDTLISAPVVNLPEQKKDEL
jgi:hypothetical protein